MDLTELAHLLATTEDRPARMSRVLYLTEEGAGLEPAGFADAIGDVATVLDRLETEGADGLAVQFLAPGGPDDGVATAAAVVASRSGLYALATAGPAAVTLDRPPDRADDTAVAACWRLVVHALAALERADAIPEPPDDPHPATYLAAAWLARAFDRVDDAEELADLALPEEAALVDELGLGDGLRGWDAVHAAVAARKPDDAERLGRNGVAWRAHDLLGDPGSALGVLAGAGQVAAADRIFDTLVDRGWARPV